MASEQGMAGYWSYGGVSAFRWMKACWHKPSSSNAFTLVQIDVFTY
ncbi:MULTISPECIES: hypothetical protein [Paenibacillus]|uniref:Uncharacterized protein n=1 Tax=Paenibacillus polymyxa TaxID=1406 RepID=A0AAP4ECX1_PAEPO|nr:MULTISPECIES: hypothetical protein [Paenibacillus]MDH2333396.1 hypothetical protein [Paenibacillus polymyxa]